MLFQLCGRTIKQSVAPDVLNCCIQEVKIDAKREFQIDLQTVLFTQTLKCLGFNEFFKTIAICNNHSSKDEQKNNKKIFQL